MKQLKLRDLETTSVEAYDRSKYSGNENENHKHHLRRTD